MLLSDRIASGVGQRPKISVTVIFRDITTDGPILSQGTNPYNSGSDLVQSLWTGRMFEIFKENLQLGF